MCIRDSLNGDVMKTEETGRISYYTSKKEVVYTSLMMCENAPTEWLYVQIGRAHV